MIRGDLSDCLVHLTKGETPEQAADNFISIIQSGGLRGGSGFIRGGYQCVCFSEAPISVLAQILVQPSVHGMRYAPFGVMVKKGWLFRAGGRPVIYQPEAEFELLHENHRYRHVRYEPDRGTDHTWEREWRVRTDELVLDPAAVTLIVPSRSWEEKFMESHAGNQRDAAFVHGKDAAFFIGRFPWHFVVLEDLGVQITWP